MTQAIDISLLVIAIALAVPVAVFAAECLAAWWPGKAGTQDEGRVPRFAVLVPAHDEGAGIEQTVHHLREQLGSHGRLLVVADNCIDRTADLARAAGAEVVERHDAGRRGKGYALDYGVRHLAADPPEVVIVVDADCRLAERSLPRLARRARASNRPVQASYLLDPPLPPTQRDFVSALALLVKNHVRPLGLRALGLPCQLTGSGMAWPWELNDRVNLATGAIVEDMRLGVEWAIVGYPPMFEPEARLYSRLPQRGRAAQVQRTRWEHGHLNALLTLAPRLFHHALRKRSPTLFAMALDLIVPPLSLLCILLVLGLALTGAAAARGASPAPFMILAIAIAVVSMAVLVSWLRFSRPLYPLVLLAMPLYVLGKVPIYFRFLTRPEDQWVRTERDAENRKAADVSIR